MLTMVFMHGITFYCHKDHGSANIVKIHILILSKQIRKFIKDAQLYTILVLQWYDLMTEFEIISTHLLIKIACLVFS